jgi:hypothetical protein
MPPRPANCVQPGIEHPTTAEHWQLSLELETAWEGGCNALRRNSALEALLKQFLDLRSREIEANEVREAINSLQGNIKPLFHTPKELVRLFQKQISYFDERGNQALDHWFRKEFHCLNDKLQSRDQILDPEFVQPLLQEYLEAFDAMFFYGSLVQDVYEDRGIK